MSLSIKIIDNDTGNVVVDESDAITVVGAIGLKSDYTIDLGIAMGSKDIARFACEAAAQMLNKVKAVING